MGKPSKIEVSGFETMAESMEFAHNYNNWILNKFTPYLGSRLLEIGTGQGNFKAMLKEKTSFYASIDIDKDVIERARERDPAGTYEVADLAADDFVSKLSPYQFDTIICVNVLEHVPDHKAGLNNMISLLKPGGHLLLFVPSFLHLYNDLDKLAGHLRRYRKGDIAELLEKDTACSIVMSEYFNPVGALGWWLNKFVTHKNINSKNVNHQVLFFDKFVVPLSKSLNHLTKKIWGQSLYCVIRKN